MNVAFDLPKLLWLLGLPPSRKKGRNLPFLTKQSLSLLEIIEVNFPPKYQHKNTKNINF